LVGCNLGCHGPVDKVAGAAQNSTLGVAFLKDCYAWGKFVLGLFKVLIPGGRIPSIIFSSDYMQAIPCEIVFVYKATVEKGNDLGNDRYGQSL
jgi:hypothetical protein